MKTLPWYTLLPLIALCLIAAIAGCHSGSGKTVVKHTSDNPYTLSIPPPGEYIRDCTKVMDFPRQTSADGKITVPSQSLWRCNDNHLEVKNEETGEYWKP
jgi:hypothetical protein